MALLLGYFAVDETERVLAQGGLDLVRGGENAVGMGHRFGGVVALDAGHQAAVAGGVVVNHEQVQVRGAVLVLDRATIYLEAEQAQTEVAGRHQGQKDSFLQLSKFRH